MFCYSNIERRLIRLVPFFLNKMTAFPLDRIPTLVDLTAKTIARHIPFELVERYKQPEQPVPENLQLKIAFWSFPDGIEDIR